ncbi:MAG: hypothetical protein QOF80_1089 [Verrucomicrobiota bacterium]
MRPPRPQAESTGSASYAYRNSVKAFFPCSSNESKSTFIPARFATSKPSASLMYSLWNFRKESFVRRLKFRNNSSASCPSRYIPCSIAKRHFRYVSRAKAAIVTKDNGKICRLPFLFASSNTRVHSSNASAERNARWGSNGAAFFGLDGGQSFRQRNFRNRLIGLRTVFLGAFQFSGSLVFSLTLFQFLFRNGKNLSHSFAEGIGGLV